MKKTAHFSKVSSRSAGQQSRRPVFFYGWTVAFVSGLALFFSGPGQTFSVSVFIDPMIQDFGWSRSLVSILYSAGTLMAGLGVAFLGRIIDQFGYRRVLTVVVSAFALACFFMSTVRLPLMLFFGFFLIRLLGQGSMSMIPNGLVPQWFIRSRGRALSLVMLFGALSSAAFPYANVVLIDAFNWQTAWRVWGFILMFVMAPLAWWLVRDRPEQIGLAPDGVSSPPPPTGHDAGNRSKSAARAAGETVRKAAPALTEERSWTFAEARQTSAFWLILIAGAIPGLVNTGLTFHHMSILTGNGLTPALAAGVFTVTAVMSIPATVGAGYLADRFASRYLLAALLLIVSSGALWLFVTASPLAAGGLGVLRGIAQGSQAIVFGVLWPSYFGRRHLATFWGAQMAVMVIGTSLGPLPVGLAYDMFGGYSQALWAMAALSLAAAATVLRWLPAPQSLKAPQL